MNRIKSVYPDHSIIGEEGYGDEVTSLDGTVWIIDPIDGTMNFVHQKETSPFPSVFIMMVLGKLG